MNAPQNPSPPAAQELEITLLPAEPSKRGRGAMFVALLLALGLACLGYYTLQLWSEQHGTRAALVSAREKVAELQKVGSQHEKQLTELGRKHDEQDEQLKDASAKLLEVSTQLGAAQSRLDELNEEHEKTSERLAEFRRMTEQFRKMIDSGRLEVAFRRGRMIVQLPAQVLFASGSADLTDEGRDAITEVAKILRKLPSKHFIVGGHTDNVPVSNDRFHSNWALSSSRAVNVTEALIRAGLRPEQLSAAGFGEYDPVASNAHEKTRQKNRRIEIVLEPKINDLPELPESDAKNAAKAKTKTAKAAH